MANTNVVQVPAHIAARIAARQASGEKTSIISSIIKGDGYSFPKISLKAAKFRLVEDGVETPVGHTLDVIIVGINPNVSKMYYDKQYDGSDNVRPACFSNDGRAPDASVEAPVHDNCATCPNNVLGSKILPSGAQSKVCADQRHLAVVPAADPNKAYSITVPVSGMKAMREYFKELQNWGLDAHEVITELSFDDKASYPKLVFARKAYPAEKVQGAIDALVQSDEVKVAIRVKAPSAAVAIAPPPTRKAIQAPAAPVVEDGYEEEPVVGQATKKATPKAAPVAEDNLSAIESEIDGLFSDD